MVLEIHNAHDRVFKGTMSDIRVARDFFEHYLPEDIKKLVNLDTLKKEPGTFINPALLEFESDILYSVSMGDQLAYFYFLCEHQSTVPILMPLRVREYKSEIWREHLKKCKNEKESERLPLILAFIFYNGIQPYSGPTNLKDIIDGPRNFVESMHNEPFYLIDVNRIEDNQFKEQFWFGLVGFFMKNTQRGRLSQSIDIILPWYKEIKGRPNTIDLRLTLLHYIYMKGEKVDTKEFLNLLNKSPESGEDLMTYTTYAESQIQESQISILISQLKFKFGYVPPHYSDLLSNANQEQISNWCIRILTANQLQDVFADAVPA